MKFSKIIFVIFFISLFGFLSCAKQCLFCAGLNCATRIIDTCSSSSEFCQKSITVTGGVEVFIKGCVSSCTDGQVQTFGPSKVTTYCCRDDLCNSAPAIFKESKFKILLVLAFVLIGLFQLRLG